LSAQLFHALPPDGWGYLRRGLYCASAGCESALKQHTAYVIGMGYLGTEYAYRHCVALARYLKGSGDSAIWAAVLAGRLAEILGAEYLDAACDQYTQALDFCREPATKVEIIYHIANLAIKRRARAGCSEASTWHEQAEMLLDNVPEEDVRRFLTVRV